MTNEFVSEAFVLVADNLILALERAIELEKANGEA